MQFHHRLRAMPKQTRTSAGSRFSTCNFIIHKRERERERKKSFFYIRNRCSQSLAPRFQFLLFWSVAIFDFESSKESNLRRAMKLVKIIMLRMRYQSKHTWLWYIVVWTDYILMFSYWHFVLCSVAVNHIVI